MAKNETAEIANWSAKAHPLEIGGPVYPSTVRKDAIIKLEESCEPCDGQPGTMTCSACHGLGMIRSESGCILLEFIAKHGDVMDSKGNE